MVLKTIVKLNKAQFVHLCYNCAVKQNWRVIMAKAPDSTTDDQKNKKIKQLHQLLSKGLDPNNPKLVMDATSAKVCVDCIWDHDLEVDDVFPRGNGDNGVTLLPAPKYAQVREIYTQFCLLKTAEILLQKKAPEDDAKGSPDVKSVLLQLLTKIETGQAHDFKNIIPKIRQTLTPENEKNPIFHSKQIQKITNALNTILNNTKMLPTSENSPKSCLYKAIKNICNRKILMPVLVAGLSTLAYHLPSLLRNTGLTYRP